MSGFETCITVVLKWEGGFVDNPHDPGGATNMGITIGTLRSYLRHPVTSQDVRNLGISTAKAIYQEYYWDTIKGDELPAGLDLVVLDTAVNCGPVRAIQLLQGVLGLEQDGHIGPITEDHMDALKIAPPGKIEEVITQYTNARLAFLRRISGWQYFRLGWTSRCMGVEHTACTLITTQTTNIVAQTVNDAGPPPGLTDATRSPRGTEAQFAPLSFWDKFTSLFKK